MFDALASLTNLEAVEEHSRPTLEPCPKKQHNWQRVLRHLPMRDGFHIDLCCIFKDHGIHAGPGDIWTRKLNWALHEHQLRPVDRS